jgi:hypothetical protein
MLEATDSEHAPWSIVRSDEKRRARLNCISHILEAIPFKRIGRPKVILPRRAGKRKCDDAATLTGRHFARERF